MNELAPIEAYPLRTSDKLRYSDTDRQGHVNNAVYSTFLETGRVELLFHVAGELAEPGAAFVIARLELDFLAEGLWPGTVEIGTAVANVGRSSITLEQVICQDGRHLAKARSVIVQMNESTRRSQPLGEAAVAQLKSYMRPAAAV
ncbi:thioesterase family protein [Stappia sp. 28M-7]|uniref:acyl-CoA thioesterase n=1 Tax=Stappia sp. 28M-7 TaxID=2762596 RepID=UPI00163C3D7F|nr:thioesterase family protein [Stappia sp. 28M-7]MBC2859499.1 acyl-CoA thioesterase [Stappia sp. 28M-7]